MDPLQKKALIAMSGGVDSSVSAWLLLNDGYELMGTTMRLYHYDKKYRCKERTCCTDRDLNDASEVAAYLGIPYEITDYEEQFKQDVIEKFVKVYESGGTPNPCIDCNKYLKFDALLSYANEHGYDYIATGHYARIEYDESVGRFLLKKAADPSKDQSYVLYNLTQEQLRHTLFPLGGLTKTKVREIATAQGFVNANKSDSQDICFIPDGNYASFIERYRQKKFPEGNYLDKEGNIIGTHKGAIRYTIGQRKGLGVAFGEPMFVCKKSMEDNTVTLDREDAVFTSELDACDMNWVSIPEPDGKIRAKAKHRYRAIEADATVTPLPDNRCHVEFDKPQRAITAGQALVLYDGDTVLGGGTIL